VKNSELQETFEKMTEHLDFTEIKVEIERDLSVKTAKIFFDEEKIRQNKLEGVIYLGACVKSDNVEEAIGHEIGHTLLRRDNPKLYKFLKYISYPYEYTRNISNGSPLVMGIYAVATGSISTLLFPYAVVAWAPILAVLGQEMMANYKAKQKGLKSLSLKDHL
jgi:hypothetical protein